MIDLRWLRQGRKRKLQYRWTYEGVSLRGQAPSGYSDWEDVPVVDVTKKRKKHAPLTAK